MALLTISADGGFQNVAVVDGSISMVKTGVWAASLRIDQVDGSGFGDGIKVTITGPAISLVGTVVPGRSSDFLDAVWLRVLGGAAGLSKPSTPRNFVQPGAFVRDVLDAICDDSGETLSNTVDPGFLQTNLTAWSVMGNTCSWNLRALLKWLGPGFSWRILPDGTLWMGTESWTQASGTFDVLEQRPQEGKYHLGCESPFIVPGVSLSGVGNVSNVEHKIESKRIRSEVYVDLPEGDRGIEASIRRMVTAQTAGFDFYALYQCQVVSQSQDLATVDVQFQSPNSAKIAGLSSVTVRAGDGVKVKFLSGASVLLGWDGGNPQAPYVCLGKSTPLSWSAGNVPGDGLSLDSGTAALSGSATAQVKAGGATQIQATASSLTLGTNPITTPVLTLGAVDSLGVPITPAPTATGTVLAG